MIEGNGAEIEHVPTLRSAGDVLRVTVVASGTDAVPRG
ncbi:MAG: hypothetical protein JWR81_5839, partial [Pseudonocardia sp.]|nr:hypothetical protein [Pseudonocardia sp.]